MPAYIYSSMFAHIDTYIIIQHTQIHSIMHAHVGRWIQAGIIIMCIDEGLGEYRSKHV